MNIRKPEAKSAINQFRKFLAEAGIEVPLNLMQEGFARSQGFEDWQAYSAHDATSRHVPQLVEPEFVPDTQPGSHLRFTGKVGEAVWVRMPSTSAEGADISVYLKRGDEGVSVDLYAADVAEHSSLAGTSFAYNEAGAVETLYLFDENGRKPMLWGELAGSPDALRFGEGPWQPIEFIDDEALVIAEALEHRHSTARDSFPRGHFTFETQASWAGKSAIFFLDLDRANEVTLSLGEMYGAQVDRNGVIYLKDGRRLEFATCNRK